MLLLAVDTAGTEGGVSLVRFSDASPDTMESLGGRWLEPRKASTHLFAAIAELLAASHLGLLEVDVFAVVSGPGSFTGLRVGLSAVKAMAEVTKKPVIVVSRLAMMAATVSRASESSPETVHTVLDAGRGEFYHGVYRDLGRTCVGERLQSVDDLAASLDSIPGTVVASERSAIERLHPLVGSALCEIANVTVDDLIPLALEAWQARKFSDIASLDANYVRRVEPRTLSDSGCALEPNRP